MRGTHERGMVKVKFVEKIKGEESLMLQQLVDEIYELELAGVKPNEIAILVRELADCLKRWAITPFNPRR